MSCPKTRHLLIEYFDDSLPAVARSEIERHLSECDSCATELAAMQSVQARLSGWQEQRTPHWDRSTAYFKAQSQRAVYPGRHWLWQWFPAAACSVMLAVLLLNVSVTSSGEGVAISFGNQTGIGRQELDERLFQFAEQQQSRQENTLRQLLAGFEERQDSSNLELVQAVLEQMEQLTRDSFDQMYTYFEQQRQLDLENVQFSYQQLLDSDFETLRTMEQLASYVQFQGEIRQ